MARPSAVPCPRLSSPMTTITDAALEALPRPDRTTARLESYKDLLRIPSISALPEHADDCRRHRRLDRGATSGSIGVEHVEVDATGGHPVVYGDWLHADGAPTVIVYCHYDVQPVDPLELWDLAAVRAGRRRRSDPRPRRVRRQGPAPHPSARAGGAARHPRRACRSTSSSSSRARRSRVPTTSRPGWTPTGTASAADFVVISDTGFFEGNLPAITVGAARPDVRPDRRRRGRRSTCTRASYGGAVQNPANALAQIIAALKGPDGRIRIPGFYDDVVAAHRRGTGGARRAALRRGGRTAQTLGAAGPRRRGRLLDPRARGARPTLDVNGIWGGFKGEGTKTIIPAHAHAKVSCRLVAAPGSGRGSSTQLRGVRRGHRAARRRRHRHDARDGGRRA